MKYRHTPQFIMKWLSENGVSLDDVMARFKFNTANDVFFLLARFSVNDYKRWLG